MQSENSQIELGILSCFTEGVIVRDGSGKCFRRNANEVSKLLDGICFICLDKGIARFGLLKIGIKIQESIRNILIHDCPAVIRLIFIDEEDLLIMRPLASLTLRWPSRSTKRMEYAEILYEPQKMQITFTWHFHTGQLA